MTSLQLEKLKSSIKRKVIFKYKPEFSASFKTHIKESQMIPLCLEVCQLLEWDIVYQNDDTIEAKRPRQYGKDTEKVIIKASKHNKVYLKSKSLEQKCIDFGNNSKRVRLFIALFQRLEKEYQISGKLEELETTYSRRLNWEDYKVPETLPKPKDLKTPSIKTPLIVGSILAIIIGFSLSISITNLDQDHGNLIAIIALLFSAFFGYLFTKLLKYCNYTFFKRTNYMIGGFVFIIFSVHLLVEYVLLSTKQSIDFNFFEFIMYRVMGDIPLRNISQGVFYILGVSLFLFLSYIIISHMVISGIIKHVINRVPEEVTEYIIYLFEQEKSEQEIRIKLAEKGWTKKIDQDYAFETIGEIVGLQELRRK